MIFDQWYIMSFLFSSLVLSPGWCGGDIHMKRLGLLVGIFGEGPTNQARVELNVTP